MERLIRHQAEHDALTGLLNRGSYEKLLRVHETDDRPFAVIMVEMTSDLKYTIEDKIAAVNEELSKGEEGMSAVSLSVGVAFSDRENPGESIFKDADKALYHVKENGRHGCHFY